MIKIVPLPQEIKQISDRTFNYSESDIVKVQDDSIKSEGYKLLINEDGVTSVASTEKGHFYALVTFRQLVKSGALPHIEIIDEPRFSYRGYMLDTCRHFFTVDEIKKQIDAISHLKLNVFHWHLTEDQGWRIQIDKYPLLTEVGSKRKQTRGDNTPVEGFYTKEEIKDVVAYAKSKHIDVMPEIDIPGHFSAAIAAYPLLSCDGKGCEVKEAFGIFEDVCCAGKETSYQFLFDVLDEVFELFPFEYIHLGGDEALRIKWINCPDCQKVIKDNGLKNEDELQAHFMSRIAAHCEKAGKKVINWNDGMTGENTRKSIVVHYWTQTKKNKAVAVRHVAGGSQGLISPFFNYYLDYPYGMTPLSKTYNYDYQKDGFIEENIIGLESPLWTEYVKTIDRAEYMTYPRLIAVAEKAWNTGSTYKNFIKRINPILSILKKLDINYAPLKDCNPRGVQRLKSLYAFAKNYKHPSSKESINRTMQNKRMLEEKYEKKD